MAFKLYNLMSASGFEGGMASGGFMMAWIGLALLVIIGMLCKKWLGEEEIIGYPYNWLGSLLGVLTYIVTVTLTGSAKLSLIIGLVGMFVGGYFSGTIFGGLE
jgi:hypothetical protein